MESRKKLRNKYYNIELLKTRIALCVIGVCLCGIAVGFFRYAAFGVDPFTSFMSGLDVVVPIDYGTLYVFVNAVLLIIVIFLDRKLVGLGTVVNLFLVGYLAEFVNNGLAKVFPSGSIGPRIICLIIGVLMLSFSAALYMPADMGVSTYDAIAMVMADKWHILQFKYDRIITDFVCVALGVTLYYFSGQPIKSVLAVVNIGTIITAFFMGPLIDIFTKNFTKRFFLKG
ncbi:MAG: hypothetical protein IK142_09615 [Clostridiales bacterium]|jgi:uncharacterized membrane protein YczE|nr:hypothetical protein [Clostridiales bacterium]